MELVLIGEENGGKHYGIEILYKMNDKLYDSMEELLGLNENTKELLNTIPLFLIVDPYSYDKISCNKKEYSCSFQSFENCITNSCCIDPDILETVKVPGTGIYHTFSDAVKILQALENRRKEEELFWRTDINNIEVSDNILLIVRSNNSSLHSRDFMFCRICEIGDSKKEGNEINTGDMLEFLNYDSDDNFLKIPYKNIIAWKNAESLPDSTVSLPEKTDDDEIPF